MYLAIRISSYRGLQHLVRDGVVVKVVLSAH